MDTTNLTADVASAPAWIRRQPGAGLPLDRLQPVDLFQLLIDLAALTAAWHLTFRLRLAVNPWMGLQFSHAQLSAAAPSLTGLLVLWSATNMWLAVSGRTSRDSGALNMFRLSESTLLVSTIATLATWVSEGMGAAVSRSFMLLFAPVSYCTLILARSAQHLAWMRIRRAWPTVAERIAIVGVGEHAREAAERIQKAGSGAVQFVGVIHPKGTRPEFSGSAEPVLGETSRLAELINLNRLQRVVVLNGSLDAREMERCTRVAKRMGVVLSQELGDPLSGVHFYLRSSFGMCLLELRPVSFTRAEEVLKRALDLVLAAWLLVVLLPLLLASAAAVRLSSKGPIFYKAPRVGRGGRYFTFYKFRTMYYDPEGRRRLSNVNERGGHIFKIRRDPRITPVGRFMRRFSIDELPQLVNVILGDMSLLGPRPLPAEDLDPDGMSRQHPTWAEMRALVKPGLTGLWQVGGRSDLPFEQMIRLDLEYIQNWSLFLDLKILLATPLVVITGRGAY